MESDTAEPAKVAAEAEVMASVEHGTTDTFVIADVSQDGAYMTLPLVDAASLPEWR
jgi:hypothetical protein